MLGKIAFSFYSVVVEKEYHVKQKAVWQPPLQFYIVYEV